MQPNKQRPLDATVLVSRLHQIIDHVRYSPMTRSFVYLGGAAVTMELVWRTFRPTGPYSLIRLHLAAMPFIGIWSYACAHLRAEDRLTWHQIPVSQDIKHLLQGVGLGAGTFFVWLGVAATQGWVSLPGWGWEQTSIRAVMYALVLHAVGHGAVTWNEEMVFRGYGFDTLRAAVGLWLSGASLTALFARAHGTSILTLSGEAALGLTLLFLRLQSGGLWLPIGYHWAANYIQIAVFGPPDVELSLRPLHVYGPDQWVGRPGTSEPGWLAIIIQCIVAIGAGMVWWLGRKRERHASLLGPEQV